MKAQQIAANVGCAKIFSLIMFFLVLGFLDSAPNVDGKLVIVFIIFGSISICPFGQAIFSFPSLFTILSVRLFLHKTDICTTPIHLARIRSRILI